MKQISKPRTPILDLQPEIQEQWDELMGAIQGVLRSGKFILGPNVKAFEGEMADYLGVKHAVGVNSGTDALVISLRALGVGPGDEVITTPFTFFATPESINNVGATPVFVDIDPATFNIDPALIEAAITERTKVILPVHLFGHPADMERIMSIARLHGLKVIEDCAQAIGAECQGRKVGSFGLASAFSFFPSKNLGSFGDGGLIATNDDAVALFAQMFRSHGARRKYENEMLGVNSRLDEMQAAILRVRLAHLEVGNGRRRKLASLYDESFAGELAVDTPKEEDDVKHVYHQYTIRVKRDRNRVAEALSLAGTETMIYYEKPCNRLPVYRDSLGHTPESDKAAREVLSLPMTPTLTPDEVRRVVEQIRS